MEDWMRIWEVPTDTSYVCSWVLHHCKLSMCMVNFSTVLSVGLSKKYKHMLQTVLLLGSNDCNSHNASFGKLFRSFGLGALFFLLLF